MALSAHVRLGARTAGMNVLLGASFLTLGPVFSSQVLALFGLDLRHARLIVAIVAGLMGIYTGNLAYTTAAALIAEHAPRLRQLHPRWKPPGREPDGIPTAKPAYVYAVTWSMYV